VRGERGGRREKRARRQGRDRRGSNGRAGGAREGGNVRRKRRDRKSRAGLVHPGGAILAPDGPVARGHWIVANTTRPPSARAWVELDATLEKKKEEKKKRDKQNKEKRRREAGEVKRAKHSQRKGNPVNGDACAPTGRDTGREKPDWRKQKGAA